MAWYGVKNTGTGAILSYVDSNARPLSGGLQYMGPYASQAAAQTALEPPVLSQAQQMIQTLRAKSSATWTLADIVDWLKAQD